MEEYDDLSAGPNDKGSINISYNDWTEMPCELYELHKDRLLSLVFTHNRLVQVPKHIGDLTLLKELNVSHNRLERIDEAIGQCIRLRKLDFSHNHLVALPKTLGNCRMLDALLLNNNKLKTIPDEIVACEALEKLYLQNNVLHYIPFKLSAIECLKDINCSGNETLSETIPIDMQGDRELILWILRLHTSYRDKIEITMDMYQTIEKSARDLELERVILHAELLKLQKDVETMRADHPLKYIELKEKTLIFLGKCRVKAREGLATGRKKLEQLLSRYKKAKIQAEEP